ncbi:uncharacterized protein LOC111637137 [Centruroides sculpturatus]|uniref:uncharacterized protein LOC111637137 n=1 Tax=Centruroides sculpturatus TaxID=218467 RepID=UPI000C6CD4F7|nr:uncharacterized protein LOC111637137 [Centruroides sculpturatus]
MYRNSCCLQNTKNGSIACGFFTLVSRSLGAILLIVGLVHLESISIYLKGNENFVYSLRIVFLTQLVDCALFITFSILLIHGVRKDNSSLMFPWIIWMIIEIGGLTILIILTLMGITQEVKLSAILATILFSLIFLGIDIYCLFCVMAQYKLLQYNPPAYSVII